MTIGERIAQIRKENNLSQEAFGEALGVTRQAISKWEADANIPDVDKLMAMSRLYGVSVGYILCMEEKMTCRMGDLESEGEKAQESQERSAADGSDFAGAGDLTKDQLRMVEEIVKRYIEAKPKKKPRRGLKILGIVGGIALIFYFQNTLGSMQGQYQNLQNNLWQVQNALDNQSSNLTYQIKKVLEEQNALLVDSGYEIAGYDLKAETVTLSLYAEPKTYAPGMTVYFGIDSDGQELTVEATADGRRYRGEITCTLTDSISMFVRIERDGVTETQIMDYLGGMRSSSAPDFSGAAPILWGDKIGTEMTRIQDTWIAWPDPEGRTKIGDAKVTKLLAVLYVNHQEYQVFPLTPDEGKYIRSEADTDSRVYYSALIEVDIPLRNGDTVTFTTRMIDTYGREFEQIDAHYVIENDEFDVGDYPQMEDLQRK